MNFLRAGCIFEAAFAVRFADYANSDRQFSKTRLAHAAERLEEHWVPILRQFAKNTAVDPVDAWWLLACLRGMLPDLEEAGL